MSKKKKYKVGDRLVDSRSIYKIIKKKKRRVLNGEKEDCVFYEPLFKTEKSQSLICSVPESNINEASLRSPVTKKRIKETLRTLGKRKNGETNVNISDADTFIKENDPVETAKLLRLLWLEKQTKDKSLSTRKKHMYENSLRHLVEEISIVQRIGLKKAEAKIKRRLMKFFPKKKVE
jgi:RNA polymerase-interacting CarD/CdnL/TRCF family regulator